MQRPEWLKHVEENTKNFGKILFEKATTGKGKYVTNLIPGLGEYAYFNNVLTKAPKKSKVAVGLILTGVRTAGIVASVATGYFPFSIGYALPTVQEEFFTYALTNWDFSQNNQKI
jgi:hypothetical protein